MRTDALFWIGIAAVIVVGVVAGWTA
jgi:hypothetical protein